MCSLCRDHQGRAGHMLRVMWNVRFAKTLVSYVDPRVVLCCSDWGWANLGVHNPGNPEVVTPNIDALIAEGILLERHYVFKVGKCVTFRR